MPIGWRSVFNRMPVPFRAHLQYGTTADVEALHDRLACLDTTRTPTFLEEHFVKNLLNRMRPANLRTPSEVAEPTESTSLRSPGTPLSSDGSVGSPAHPARTLPRPGNTLQRAIGRFTALPVASERLHRPDDQAIAKLTMSLAHWVESGPPEEVRNRQAATLKIKDAFVSKAVSLSLDGLALTELPYAMRKLTALDTLSINGNRLTKLPHLPPAVTQLQMNNNLLEEVSYVPKSLTGLSVNGNRLTRLDCHDSNLKKLALDDNAFSGDKRCSLKLPTSLIELSASRNKLVPLRELPPRLEIIEANDTQIPDRQKLPASLVSLSIAGSTWNGAHKLPKGLKHLNMSRCMLTDLPKLPKSLRTLNVEANYLEALPQLPPTLETLNASNNGLLQFPSPGPALKHLILHHNRLTRLPALDCPLVDIDITDNPIQELPTLPATIQHFRV